MPLREYLNTLYFHVGISILLTGKRGKRRKREKERKRKIEKERERERESYYSVSQLFVLLLLCGQNLGCANFQRTVQVSNNY